MSRNPPQEITDRGSLPIEDVLEDPETTMVYFDLGDQRFVDRPAGYWKAKSPVAVARLIEQAGKRIQFHLRDHHEFVQALARVKRAFRAPGGTALLEGLSPVSGFLAETALHGALGSSEMAAWRSATFIAFGLLT